MTDVDVLSRGLVREYLARKKLTSVLQQCDREWDKEADGSSAAASVNSSKELSRCLKLGKLQQKNKQRRVGIDLTAAARPYGSLLELLTHFFFQEDVSRYLKEKQRETSHAERSAEPAAPKPLEPPRPAVAPTAAQPEPAGGGFWARLEAAKRTKAEQEIPAPSPAAAPASSPSPAASPAPSPAPADASGGTSFWARLQAAKQSGSSSGGASAAASVEEFVAPDGKRFTDKFEYRRYVFRTFYCFSDKVGETLVKTPGEIQGQAFNLENLEDCTVHILDHTNAMHLERLRNCRVFVAACSESLFMRDCHNCEFTVACKQLRTRACSHCRVFLYVKGDPIIETSHHMEFAPFNGASPQLDELFTKAHLEPNNNHWSCLFDFNDGETAIPEPHWSLMDPDAWKPWEIELESFPPPMNPVPRDAAAIVPEADEANGEGVWHSFDIRTTQAEAEQRVRELQADEASETERVDEDSGEG